MVCATLHCGVKLKREEMQRLHVLSSSVYSSSDMEEGRQAISKKSVKKEKLPFMHPSNVDKCPLIQVQRSNLTITDLYLTKYIRSNI